MPNNLPERFTTISSYHQALGLSKPEHPLISVIDMSQIKREEGFEQISLVFDFYLITIIKAFDVTFRYGQLPYDFDQGIVAFMAPNQVLGIDFNTEEDSRPSGWILCIHPDFLWNTPLARIIRKYEYFKYYVNEALHISEKEEAILMGIIKGIEQEYHLSIDKFSQDIIISQLEVFLNYSERFYQRQFITRKITNHKTLVNLEEILEAHFRNDMLVNKGIPTVKYIADQLHVSPDYLSKLLKTLTGKNVKEHIQEKVIEKAKEKLSTTHLSVSEIAFLLGFEHSQSFSKLFKNKTNFSPMEFRASFNS